MAKPKYLTDPKTFNDEYHRLVELKKTVSDLQIEVNKIAVDFRSVQSLPDRARSIVKFLENRNSRSKNILSNIGVAQKEAVNVSEEISKKLTGFEKIIEKSQKDSADIDDLKQKTKETQKEAEEIKRRIDELSADMRDILGKAADASLSAAFANRARWISASTIAWALILLAFSAGSPFIAVYVFTHVDPTKYVGSNLFAIDIFRLATLSPLAFFIGYASIQYSKERDLQSRYAYKSTLAKSLTAYTKLMNDEFYGGNKPIKNHEDDLVKFAFESIGKIYEEPFVEHQKRTALIQINKSGAVINAQEEIKTKNVTGISQDDRSTVPVISKPIKPAVSAQE